MSRGLALRLGRQLLQGCSATDSIFSVRLKQTTGIVGLDVVPEARSVLRQRCEEVKRAVQIIPETAEYRKVVESTMDYRIKATDSQSTDEEIEQQFGFQLEELIEQCKDELGLIPDMAVWKPWEVPPGHKVEVITEEDVPAEEGALPLRKIKE